MHYIFKEYNPDIMILYPKLARHMNVIIFFAGMNVIKLVSRDDTCNT